MTDDEREIGTVESNRVLTAAGWVPLRFLPANATPPFYAGDVKGGHAFTGTDWVPLPERPQPVATKPLPTLATPKKSEWALWASLAVVVVIAVAVLVVLVREVASKSDADAPTATQATETPTSAPATTEAVDPKKKKRKPAPDPDVAYANKMQREGWTEMTDGLWGKFDGSESDQFTVTWKLRVVSPKGCSKGVYVEANVLDTSNTVVGYTNAVLPSLSANQQGVLELTSTADGTVHLEPTEVNCY